MSLEQRERKGIEEQTTDGKNETALVSIEFMYLSSNRQ